MTAPLQTLELPSGIAGQSLRVAYADPPYIGQAKKHYSHDPRCAEVDHAKLIVRRCLVEVWTGRITQWRLVREYASRRNAKRAIPSLKAKLGTHELRWMDSPNVPDEATPD